MKEREEETESSKFKIYHDIFSEKPQWKRKHNENQKFA